MNGTNQEFGIEVFRFRADAFTRQLIKLVSHVSDKAVHETRVESRRMRVALDSFRDMFPPFPYNSAYKAVRQIAHLLGEPRETSVISGLIQELAQETLAGHACLDYLQVRLNSKLRKQKTRLEKKLGRIDPLRVHAKIDFLISIMEPSELKEPTLFPMCVTAAMRFCRILESLTALFAECRPTRQFDLATDADLHSLRIAAKKARYTMEIFSPVWPGGLGGPIEKARKFQEAAGVFNDWGTLLFFLETEMKRLNSTESVHLVFEMGRLAEYIELRKRDLKVAMRPALMEFLESLVVLQRMVSLLTENPDLRSTDLIRSGIRAKARPRLKRAIRSA